ncbi:LytTR family DNA-binding domain-containing protein [Variovorax sp. NFACC27]|uniref:LytTR family DNA-binding domain-containing protein n=1 Tax=unclassified Variovorax TaxID=663243 RepID=UPI00089C8977|nr:transcriptional regulator, LytTR family [Variovorax sp. NFACC28]SEG28216.1 transcriptional regulator, LytTR family [Variovorax sp. NFACC29]SFC44106.1 transcriptional regulator, LytTR family [Variovorax sp. NFACC26]SFF91379.1 transcriptional regulator, LytTR family [Variovorax sp. NFACC27]
MGDPRKNLYERYAPIRRPLEVAFWIVLMSLHAVFSTMVAIVDMRTRAVPRPNWEVATWEGSSHLVLLLLVPVLAAVERRLSPLARTHLPRFLGLHLVASVVFSVAHVVGMFGLRALVYAMAGERYDFWGWAGQWSYEYLKDVRGYVSIVFGIWAYRLFLLRLQGEARVLDAPEEGVAMPPPAPAPALAEPVGFEPPVPETPQPPPSPPPPPARPERFLVRKLRREFLIAATDIDWLQAEGNYVGLHVNGHDYLLRSTLTDFLTQLDPALFARVHRSHAVNLGRIKEIEPLDGGDARLHMHDGTTVPCSRRYRDALRTGIGAA